MKPQSVRCTNMEGYVVIVNEPKLTMNHSSIASLINWGIFNNMVYCEYIAPQIPYFTAEKTNGDKLTENEIRHIKKQLNERNNIYRNTHVGYIKRTQL